MVWPFQKSAALIPRDPVPPPEKRLDPVDLAIIANENAAGEQQKNFDWMHYQALTQGAFGSQFTGEFNLIPTTRILKGMYLQEPWINYCISAIMRQFITTNLELVQTKGVDKETVVKKHKFLSFMKLVGSDVESSGFFTANNIADLVLGGNCYWWTSKDLKQKKRIPCERIEPTVRDNKIVEYRLIDRNDLTFDNKMLVFQPEEITHVKLPNPFTPHVGLSMVIATILPVLIDKYGLEYVVAFFLRGGNTAGIIETNSIQMDQLLKFSRSLMTAFGSRRNMHADKILPQGATWKGQGNTFAQIGLKDMIAQNLDMFKAATGCTDTVLGISKNVTRATAEIEMELFYQATVFPLQTIYCMGIMGSPLWKRFGFDESWELRVDNSHLQFLDDFDNKLDQDLKMKSTWTINERRERQGLSRLTDPLYDKLEIELYKGKADNGTGVQLEGPDGVKKSEAGAEGTALADFKAAEAALIDDPTKPVSDLFDAEFHAWEQIVLDNLQNRNSGSARVRARGPMFARHFADAVIAPAMRAYDSQVKVAVAHRTGPNDIVTKEQDADRQAKMDKLRQRAEDVVKGKILSNGKDHFDGYSDNMMKDVYDTIENLLNDGQSLDEVAFGVRQQFGEAYTGQGQTIVRTEYGAAVSEAQAQFADDLASVTDRMSKAWVTMDDGRESAGGHVRDSHMDCEEQGPLEGDSADIVDTLFVNGLRYPRDSQGDASEIINCRCTIRYRPLAWSD